MSDKGDPRSAAAVKPRLKPSNGDDFDSLSVLANMGPIAGFVLRSKPILFLGALGVLAAWARRGESYSYGQGIMGFCMCIATMIQIEMS